MMITNLVDLKAAIASPAWFEVLQAQESWLPSVVASLSWETRMSAHVLLHYYIDHHDETDEILEHLLGDLEQIYAQLIDFLQITPQNKQEQILLQARLNLFFIKTQTKRVFGSLTDPHLLLYFWDPKAYPDYPQKLRHELTHWLWSRLYGEGPALFQEGLADYAEYLSGPQPNLDVFWAKRFGDIAELPPLTELALTANFWRYGGSYGIGGQFVAFLVEQWGWWHLKKLFLHSVYEDEQIDEHFTQIYGQSLAEADQAWRIWLRNKVSWAN
jgi:hypothetical protein